jgi:LPS sulfotransferase NodH
MATNSLTANGVCAVKIHLYDFLQVLERARTEFGSSLDERELLEICFPSARYIFVRREDRVRQSISFLRAMDSMQWQRLRGEQASERMERLEIDLDQIDQLVKVFTDQEDQWRGFFARNDLTAYEVVYEDLVRDYERITLGALEHLGITSPAKLQLGPPRTIRQSDHLTERAVAMYTERFGRTAGMWSSGSTMPGSEPPAVAGREGQLL